MSDMQLQVFRKVEDLEPTTVLLLTQKNLPEKGKLFPGGFVANDYPRDWAVADELMSKTIGYAVADEDGQVLAEYSSLTRAELARDTAKVSFSVDVTDLPSDGEDGE